MHEEAPVARLAVLATAFDGEPDPGWQARTRDGLVATAAVRTPLGCPGGPAADGADDLGPRAAACGARPAPLELPGLPDPGAVVPPSLGGTRLPAPPPDLGELTCGLDQVVIDC